jgi:dipeptidyl-peptidase 4
MVPFLIKKNTAKNTIIKLIASAVSFLFFIQADAQELKKSDYNRAVSFMWRNIVNKKVFNDQVEAKWFKDSTGVGFAVNGKDGKKYQKVEWKTKKVEDWFDHKKLAQTLSDSLKKKVDEKNLPIQNTQYLDKNHITFQSNNIDWTLDLRNYKLEKKININENPLESKSPDGKWIAYMENYNLFIKSTVNNTIKKLSTKGERYYEFGTYYGWSDMIEGENGVRPPQLSVYWSPDSKWIQTYIVDFRGAKKMYLLDWSIDSLYKPKLLSYYRGSPGDTDMVKMTPVFYNIETGTEIIKHKKVNTHTFPVNYEWAEKEAGIVFEHNLLRGYKERQLSQYNLHKNSEILLYNEIGKTNVDNFEYQIVSEWGKIIILSEKTGWRQMYLLDITTKKIEALTTGEYFINDILYVDKKKQFILFTASGKEVNRNNPYEQRLYKVSTKTKKVELLSPENLNHDVSISPDGSYFFDNISSMNQPTTTFLKNHEGQRINISIAKAEFSRLDSVNYKLPEQFNAIGKDGKTTIYGAIWKPSNFDLQKKYPVIDQSYTGPHTNMFPRNFSTALARSNQALSELGFIVVTVDGLGSAGRSKAFHDVSYKNMGKNLEDHRLAILQLGRKYNYIDTTKVGIFGHSAGGFDAGHAMLEYPDFYKVAVASSADHDFRMEKDWWPEMYMGWPVDSSYHKVSNITMAGNLKGKLLLVHGGIDENVNPSATFKFAEALIKNNKEFDMLIIPSQRHGYQGIHNDYFNKKRWNYFVEHLLGKKPIWDFELK